MMREYPLFLTCKKMAVPTLIFMVSFLAVFAATETAHAVEPSLLWEIPDFDSDTSSPIVGSDGTIYVGSSSQMGEGMYAVNPNGTIKWMYETDLLPSTPALGDDGSVYFSTDDGFIYALTVEGALKWRYETGSHITGSPAIGHDGSIYVGSMDGFLYAFSPNGEVLWKHIANILSSPVVGPDGTVYVAGKDSYIHAVSPTGVRRWAHLTSYPNWGSYSTPAFGPDDTVYYGSKGNKFYALNPDGTLKWSRIMFGVGDTSPAVAADGSIYVVSNNGTDSALYCLNDEGTTKWEYRTGHPFYSSPSIGYDGTIYIGGSEEVLHAITPEGTQKWAYELDIPIYSCPALTPDGTMYIGTESFIALETDAYGYQPDSPWPSFTFSPKHSVAGDDLEFPDHFLVTGRVTLPDLTPFADVMVSANGLTTQTNANGEFSVLLPDGTYTITVHIVHAEVPRTRDIVVQGGPITVDLYEGPDGMKYTVTGRLVSPSGALAEIPVSASDLVTETDIDGLFSFQLANGSHRIEIDAGENHLPVYVDLTMQNGDMDIGEIPINTIEWSREFDRLTFPSSPVIDQNGTLYFTTIAFEDRETTSLCALSPDNEKIHQIPIESGPSHPVIGPDGTIYIFFSGGLGLGAFDTDLSQKWSFSVAEPGPGSEPTIGDDGSLYFGTIDRVYALTPGGEKKWEFYIGDRVTTSPVIAPDSTIYISCDNSLYALSHGGELKWQFDAEWGLTGFPLIGSDGTIYVGSHYKTYALNPDGTIKWEFESGGAVISDALFDEDVTLYVVSSRTLYALNLDGTIKWEFRSDDSFSPWCCPGTHEIWLTGSSDTITALRRDGTVSWRASTAYKGFTSAPDGTVYTVSYVGNYATMHAITIPLTAGQPTMVSNNDRYLHDSEQPLIISDIMAFPNPFNPATTISFSLSRAERVSMDVYSVTGQKIATLVDEALPAGTHAVRFDGTGLASGVYFARLEAGSSVATQKMLLVK